MSNGTFSKSKLESSAAPSVRDKVEFYVQAMGATVPASARAVSVDGDVDRHTMQIYEMDEHKGELARLMTEIDVWCVDPAPAPGRPRTFITLVIDQQTRSICGVGGLKDVTLSEWMETIRYITSRCGQADADRQDITAALNDFKERAGTL